MRFLFLFLVALGLGACSEQPPAALAPEAEAERDSVLALLRTADTDAFDAAYSRLGTPDYLPSEYLFTTKTQQLHPDGDLIATRTRTYRITMRGAVLVESDSSGTLDFGGFEGVAGRRWEIPGFSVSPASLALPDEPAYLDPRGREVFTFALVGDTLIGDRPLRILSVTARPGEGDDQSLRAARLYLDTDGALVGARVHRMQESILFGEESTLALFLQPSSRGWLPDYLTVDTHIRAPLTAPRRFRQSERYDFSLSG